MNHNEVMQRLDDLMHVEDRYVLPWQRRVELRELVTSLLDENDKLRAMVQRVRDADPHDLSVLIDLAQKALENE